mmetsp:Transcript_9660/g.12534  ORF Transcript_9660/g.12534 Transcript_9660/m.12534 type:complete len:201 (+) Transcript_9660:114-716(+)
MPPAFGGRGRGSPGGRGGRGRGGGGRGGGGRGGFGRRPYDEGPPSTVIDLGIFSHTAEEDMVCNSTLGDKVPYFNAPVYLENKSKIGKVDEVFGPVNAVMFTVKTDDGVVASSFKENDKVYISPEKILPIARFTGEQKGGGGRGGRGGRGGGGRGGGRGGRGGGRGGRGGFGRGGGRGGRGGIGRGGGRGGRGRGGRGRF